MKITNISQSVSQTVEVSKHQFVKVVVQQSAELGQYVEDGKIYDEEPELAQAELFELCKDLTNMQIKQLKRKADARAKLERAR